MALVRPSKRRLLTSFGLGKLLVMFDLNFRILTHGYRSPRLNGSDPLWATNQKHYSQFEYIGRTQAVPARHYRNHGELQHSLRSIIKSYSGSIGQQHLVLGDWHSEGEEMMRVGQRPGWLKVGKGIKEVWHSEIWNSWNEEKQRRGLDEVITERNEYLRSGLPTFNR